MNQIALFILTFLSTNSIQSDLKGILIDRTIVEVEKEAITLLDLDAHSKIQIVLIEGPESLSKINDAAFINSMINLMVNRELIAQELKKEKRFKPHTFMKEAENLFLKMRSRFKGEGDFRTFLADINMNEQDLKRVLAIYLMIDDYMNRLADEKVKVDEDDIKRYIQSKGISTPLNGELLERVKNEIKQEKKKGFVTAYLEGLKSRYRIRYLYIPK